jgi:phosphoenolpyruvate carboxylase
MAYDDERLIEAARHVANGKRIVARQRALVTRLKACGSSTLVAEQTLRTFLRSLAIFEDDLRQLQIRGGRRRRAHQSQMKDPRAIEINGLRDVEFNLVT